MSQHITDGSLGFLLNKGTLALQRHINRNFNAQDFNLTYEQWSVLIYLFHTDGKSQNEIAENTFRDKVSVTKIIDNLEKQNMVIRTSDSKDRRIRRVFLTDKGKEVVPKLKQIANLAIKKAFEGMSKKDIEAFNGFLSLIVKNITGEEILNFVKNNKGRWN